jgi:hypothetical protein
LPENSDIRLKTELTKVRQSTLKSAVEKYNYSAMKDALIKNDFSESKSATDYVKRYHADISDKQEWFTACGNVKKTMQERCLYREHFWKELIDQGVLPHEKVCEILMTRKSEKLKKIMANLCERRIESVVHE